MKTEIKIRLKNRKTMNLLSASKTSECFDPLIKKIIFRQCLFIIIAVHSLISVKILSSACVKSLEFVDINLLSSFY